MAKALLGHVGIGPDQRLVIELRRAHARISQLQEELERVRAENEALVGSLHMDSQLDGALGPDMLRLDDAQPALT